MSWKDIDLTHLHPEGAFYIFDLSALTRRIEFYPYDALHDAMAVDGTALFYIQKSRVDEAARCP